MVFPVVMYGCESWTVKKAERRRIDDFELWCWRRLLRVPWTARRSNWSIVKEISPGCSLEGLMLRLKLQYFGHLMQRVDSLEKTLMLGEIGGRRRRGRQRMRWLDGITDSMGMSLSELGVGDGQRSLACCNSWGHKESDTTEWLNWTELILFWNCSADFDERSKLLTSTTYFKQEHLVLLLIFLIKFSEHLDSHFCCIIYRPSRWKLLFSCKLKDSFDQSNYSLEHSPRIKQFKG